MTSVQKMPTATTIRIRRCHRCDAWKGRKTVCDSWECAAAREAREADHYHARCELNMAKDRVTSCRCCKERVIKHLFESNQEYVADEMADAPPTEPSGEVVRAFERVRRCGSTNMYDVRMVSMLSGCSEEDIMKVLRLDSDRFVELREYYCDTRTDKEKLEAFAETVDDDQLSQHIQDSSDCDLCYEHAVQCYNDQMCDLMC